MTTWRVGDPVVVLPDANNRGDGAGGYCVAVTPERAARRAVSDSLADTHGAAR